MSIHHGSLAPARAQLVATGVHVERGGRPVLADLTFAVNRGTRLGIVGENGRGKSTLLHVLSGATLVVAGCLALLGFTSTATGLTWFGGGLLLLSLAFAIMYRV